VPQQEEPFKYPKQKGKINPVQIYKGQFQPLIGRRLEMEYREAYPDKNFNNVRCFKTPVTATQKPLLQWKVSLREAGGQTWSWNKTQKAYVSPQKRC
jgi:hypothetical protein